MRRLVRAHRRGHRLLLLPTSCVESFFPQHPAWSTTWPRAHWPVENGILADLIILALAAGFVKYSPACKPFGDRYLPELTEIGRILGLRSGFPVLVRSALKCSILLQSAKLSRLGLRFLMRARPWKKQGSGQIWGCERKRTHAAPFFARRKSKEKRGPLRTRRGVTPRRHLAAPRHVRAGVRAWWACRTAWTRWRPR